MVGMRRRGFITLLNGATASGAENDRQADDHIAGVVDE
jgi:hypothetical protein